MDLEKDKRRQKKTKEDKRKRIKHMR